MRVQISGAVQLASEWQSVGQFRDVLATGAGDVSGMIGQNQQRVVPTVPVVSVLLNGPAPGFDDAMFFASLPGGTLEVTADTYPPRPGLDE